MVRGWSTARPREQRGPRGTRPNVRLPRGDGYTSRVKSVADHLRDRTQQQVLALPVPDRIELALALGDDDLRLFMAASGLDRAGALARVRAQRRRGRTPSQSASAEP